MKKKIYQNSLSIVFVALFVMALICQIFFGFIEYNKELNENGASSIKMMHYLQSGHFLQATFENWESEFLQMALFVWLTIFLKQKGSSESKSLEGKEEVDQQPNPNKKHAPWPVKKGGLWLAFYKHSLTISLLILFIFSFIIHFYGSLTDQNVYNSLNGKPLQNWKLYFLDSRFWFESFQNWQSEFLSVFAIVGLSIYLRQIGSPQSKPVDTPNNENGN